MRFIIVPSRLLKLIFLLCINVQISFSFQTQIPLLSSNHYIFYRNQDSFVSLFAKSGKKKKKVKDGTISVNRLAYRNYEIIDTLEAGISLFGTEVKSIRDGKMNIRDGFVRPTINKKGCTLHNVHIGKHSQTSNYFNHEETRVRNLLVHKSEARRLSQSVERQGMTIVPLKAYFNNKNQVKLQIGLCKGKNVRDKRQSIKEKEAKRDANRMIKNFRLS